MQSLLAVSLVAHLVEGQVGHRAQRVREAELLHPAQEVVEGLQKELRIGSIAVHVDAAETRRTGVAQDAVFTIVSRCFVVVVKHVGDGVVVVCRNDVAQAFVDGPLRNAYGHVLNLILRCVSSPGTLLRFRTATVARLRVVAVIRAVVLCTYNHAVERDE